jgi:CMP-N-acetylneuraminic acid synthetase
VRIAAIVPMRHESERVPGKNYRELAGRPLYAYILETLLACSELEDVIVDTDSAVIRAGVEERYPSIRVVERPDGLRGPDVPMNDVLLNDLTATDSELILQTHCTNPLLRAETISAALRALLDAGGQHDSLFSVTEVRKRFWADARTPVNHDPSVLLRTQDLPPLYEENSCLYVFRRETLEKLGNRIGARPLLFPIDPNEAWDIDDEADWELVDLLATRAAEVRR